MGGQEGTRVGAMKNVFVKIFGAGLCLQALMWPSFPEVERGAVVVCFDMRAINLLDGGTMQCSYLSECGNFLSIDCRGLGMRLECLLMRLAERFSTFSQPRPPEGRPHGFGWCVGNVFL